MKKYFDTVLFDTPDDARAFCRMLADDNVPTQQEGKTVHILEDPRNCAPVPMINTESPADFEKCAHQLF